MKKSLSPFVILIACIFFGTGLKAQFVKKLGRSLSGHYEDRSVINEFQAGTINTETENYQESAVAKYNSLFSNYGLQGYISYFHTGPFRHHLFAYGGKYIYGRNVNSYTSQTLVVEAMMGRNTERNISAQAISKTDVFGVSGSAASEWKWIGVSLGFSAGKFVPRNDHHGKYFSTGRFSAFDIFGRYRVRVLPHRWFFLEYSSNNLFLFHGGQGKLNQFAAGTGLGLKSGSELKGGYITFLKSKGAFIEATLYFNNKIGAGVNYTVYNTGSNYTSFKLCYRYGKR